MLQKPTILFYKDIAKETSRMTTLQFVLSTLIRNGKVTVEIPDINMDELRQAVENRAEWALEEIKGIVYEEDMTDAEKVAWIQKRLELK